MGARQHIVELKQRMVGRRRLLGPDVETRACNEPVAQRLEQRGFIVDKTSRRGDEIGVWLHQREFARPYHAAAFPG